MTTWPVASLKECTRVVSGATPKSKVPEYWEGNIAWVTPKDLSNLDSKLINDTPRKITAAGLKSCSAELLPPNSVLFSSRAPIGHVAINSIPMATNQGFKSFIPKKGLDASYLYWWLRAHRKKLENLGNGATFKEVSKSVVERVEIPLPPLDEQKRIAAILDQADALRRLRQRAIDKLNTLGQSIFYEMFGDRDQDGSWKYPTKRLADVCNKITDGTHQAPKWAEEGIPFIFVSNVRDQSISLETKKFVSRETYEELTRLSPIEAGDVLYTAVGSYGHAAVVADVKPFLFQRHIAHIKPNADCLSPLFLSYCLETLPLKRQADRAAKGVAQKTVTLTDIKEFEIPNPPKEKQEEFAKKIVSFQLSSSRELRHLRKIETLFSSLQQRAFRGEL